MAFESFCRNIPEAKVFFMSDFVSVGALPVHGVLGVGQLCVPKLHHAIH